MSEGNKGVLSDDELEALRKRAESKLQALNLTSLEAHSPDQIRQVIYELQVYQVELEMQQEELRNAQLQQAKSEANYRHLYQFAPTGYFTLNANGGVEECNFAAAQLLGAERKQLVGKLLRSFVPTHQRALFDSFFADLLWKKTIHRCEVELYSFGDSPAPSCTVVLEGASLAQEGEQVSRYLITVLDITERKQAELALQAANHQLEEEVSRRRQREQEMQAAKNLLQSVFDASVSGICLARSVPGYQGQTVDFECQLTNQAFAKLLGQEMTNTMYFSHFPLANIPGLLDKLRGVVQSGERWSEEIQYRQDNRLHYFYLVALPLADGLVITLTDLTQQKQVEEQLREVEKNRQKQLVRATWEAQEEEKRRLSEVLHNGLAQYLYAIRLHVDGIKLQGPPESLSDVQASKKKAEQLLLEAIAQTRSLSHELTPAILEEFGLPGAIQEFCGNMNGQNLWIHCRVEAIHNRLSKHLEMAIYRISQELINNVIKHAKATDASLTISQQEEEISIQVIDNGQGFDRAEVSKKGIGLHSIRNRVHLLDGIMDIQSQPGQGTEIRIWLPIA